MKKIIAMLMLIWVSLGGRVAAQEETYRYDIGGQLGVDGYLGDASSSIFAKPGVSFGASFRYLPDVRWAVRTVFNVFSLSGDTSKMDDVLPGFEQYTFKSTAYDLGARVEFNFFAYGIGETYKKLRRWSPYLTLGVGFTLATCQGENAFGVNIPMGAGVKYKLRERWNLGFEFTMTKVFSDHVDGPLADLYQIKSSFIKNTDWYSNISLSISYEFGKRCATCHYVD